jgi:tetratricopeptide (TPR) repeat protein
VVAERTGTPPHSQVKVSGSVPPLADSFYQRPETGLDLRAGLYPGDIVVLTHGEETASAPAAQGGTGKTQLAVAFTHALWGARAVDALVWVAATSREAIITGFAQAAETVGAADQDLPAEAAANRFIDWLARTRRRWALILDDLGNLADLDNLWPAGPAGQVVITTRLPQAAFQAGPGPSQPPRRGVAGPRIAPVGGFSRREVLAYLSARLTDHPDQRIEALDLGADLDGLALGLAQAAGVMSVSRLSCREYRGRFGERRKHMSAVRVDGVSPAVLATWSLAAECAHEFPPAGVAWPALALAAMLDPHGIPGAVLTSPAGCGYVAGRPSVADGADQALVRAAMTNLARVGLVSIDPASPARTVRMHPSVQAAVRAYVPADDFEQAVRAAADALMQAWPEPGGRTRLEQAQQAQQAQLEHAQLEQALRDCTGALPAAGYGALWQPEVHPVLFRTGLSLLASGRAEAAITCWQRLLITSTRLLGSAHANAVAARDGLAAAYESAERFGDAIEVFASALADRERTLGPGHPDTITARGHLAHAYASAGRPGEAVALYEQMVAGASRQPGPGHPVTLAARASLASAYQAAGRGREALTAYTRLVTDAERLLGARHPSALAARDSLAAAFAASGQPREAIEQYKRLVADTEAAGGRDHPDAIAARASLASAYHRGGKLKDAIALYRRVLADRERVQGPDHADTRSARVNLAAAYQQAGRLTDAIHQYQQALADCERMVGPDHPMTRTVRENLEAITRT